MQIRDRVTALLAELPREPQYATQGATLFIDLERRETLAAYATGDRARVGGRDANMCYFYRLLDETTTLINAGDCFPSFLHMNGFDHVVLYGRAPAWSLMIIRQGAIEFRGADAYVGMDDIDMRAAIQRDLDGTGAKMGSLQLKAIITLSTTRELQDAFRHELPTAMGATA